MRPRPLPRPPREAVLAVAALVALSALPFWRAIFLGGVLYRRDIAMVWRPMAESFVHSVAEGSWPLWDPHRGFGQPLLADPRAEVLYPVTWLNLILPPGTYYTLFVVSHFVLSALGLRALARRWGMSSAGAFVSAAAWILSGPLLSLALMWHHLAGAAWLPWQFLAMEDVLEGGGGWPIGKLALVTAAQILAGSPDYSLLGGLALAGYVALLGIRWRSPTDRDNVARVSRLALGAMLGLALAAAQWLPTLDWASRAQRSNAGATVWSLHPLALLEAAAPLRWNLLPLSPEAVERLLEGREPWLPSVYLGAAVLALSVVGALFAPERRRRFLTALAVVAALGSLGKYTPLYAAAAAILPLLHRLRFPVKAMVLLAFATSLLAGLGVDALRDRRRSERARVRWAPAIAAAFVALTLSAVLGGGSAVAGLLRPGARLPAVLFRDLGFAAACAAAVAAAAVAARRLAPALLTLLLVGLPVLDLAVAHIDLHPVAPAEIFRHRPEPLPWLVGPDARLYVHDYSIRTPGADADPRVYRLARMPAGWSLDAAVVLGVETYLNPPTAGPWGLDGSYDPDILDFDPPVRERLTTLVRASEGSPLERRLLRLGAVTRVLALHDTPSLPLLARVPGYFVEPIRISGVPDTLPRALAVGNARVADDASVLDAISDPAFEPRHEVLVPPPRAALSAPNFEGSARIVSRRADEVVIDASLSKRGYVVLLDAFDPGWHGEVDGGAAEVVPADGIFRAVATPAGSHRIRFAYRPPAVFAGLAISFAACLVILLLAVRESPLPRASPPAAL